MFRFASAVCMDTSGVLITTMKLPCLRLLVGLGYFAPTLLWAFWILLPTLVKPRNIDGNISHAQLLEQYLPAATSSAVAALIMYVGAILLLRFNRALFNVSANSTFWLLIGATVPLLVIVPIGTVLGIIGIGTLRKMRFEQKRCQCAPL